jgi:hypothetical protein
LLTLRFWDHAVFDLHDGFANVDAPDKSTVYSTTLFGGHTVDLIAAHDPSVPLFVYHAWNAVHNDLSVPADFEASDEYARVTSLVTADPARMLLAGALFLVDQRTKKVIDALKTKGMFEHSYVIVASDNGGSPKDGGNNSPLRGSKKTLYDGGVRVPAFVASPLLPASAQGSVYTALFHVTDWLPTIVHGMAGLATDASVDDATTDMALDGVNQFDALVNPAAFPSPLRSSIVLNLDYVTQAEGSTDATVAGTSSFVTSAAESWSAVISEVGGVRYKLILGQEDVRTYEPFTGTARGESEDGYFTFL